MIHNNNTENQKELLHEFLQLLYGNMKGYIELRPIGDGGNKTKYNLRGFYEQLESIYSLFDGGYIEQCKQAKNGLFFGVLPRTQRSGKKSAVNGGHVIWSDIDDKDTGGRKESWAYVEALPIPPSVIIESGGGLHIYYVLNQHQTNQQIEEMNKQLLHMVKGDKSAWNADRILRLPTSWHCKQEPAKLVTFAGGSWDEYQEDYIKNMLSDVRVETKKAIDKMPMFVSTKNDFSSIRPIMDPEIMVLLTQYPELTAYYMNEGKQTGPKTYSDYDYIFAKELSYRRCTLEQITNALHAKIVKDGRNARYIGMDGVEKRPKTKQYIETTAFNAWLKHNQNSPSVIKAAAQQEKPKPLALVPKYEDTTSYNKLQLDNYPEDYRDKSKRGKPKVTLDNCHAIISEMANINGFLRYNLFKCQLEFQGDAIKDHNITDLRLQISKGYGVSFTKEMVGECLEHVAHTKQSYHPVQDYLSGLEWDGVKRIESLFYEYGTLDNTHVKPEHKDLIQAMTKRWFISAIARIMKAGCKVDASLVLMGGQGIGKSTFFRMLAVQDDWFSDSAIDIRGGRDSYSKLKGKWIYEFAELADTKKRDSEVTKAFLSSQSDLYRPAYARYEVNQKRQVVFCGTTNELEIFKDSENRRYYPIPLVSLELERIKADRDQIWAEAKHYYSNGEPWHLIPEEASNLAEYQAPYKATDTWLEAIEGSECIVKPHTLKEICEIALRLEPSQQNRAVLMRLAGILSGAKWKKTRKTVNGKRVWLWSK